MILDLPKILISYLLNFLIFLLTAYVDTLGIGSISAGELSLTKSAKIEKNLEVTGIATIGAGLSVLAGDLFSQGQIVGQNNGS